MAAVASPATYTELESRKPFFETGFGRLPGELRNQIYELASPPEKTVQVSPRSPHPMQPSLAIVCRQLRTETLVSFYTESQFVAVVVGASHLDLVADWLRAIGSEYARHIRHLTFRTSMRSWAPDVLRAVFDLLTAVQVCRDAVRWEFVGMSAAHEAFLESMLPLYAEDAGYPFRSQVLVCGLCVGCAMKAHGGSEDHILGGNRSTGIKPPLYAGHMVGMVSEETGMTLAFSRECLVQSGWDAQEAVNASARVRNRLPGEAFISSRV